MFRAAALLVLALALAGCGNELSSQRATTLILDHWHHEGISMEDLGLCSRLSEECIAATRCIEPVAAEFLTQREAAWRSFGVYPLSERDRLEEIVKHFPAFMARDVQIQDLTHHLRDGIRPGVDVRETAQVTAHLVPSREIESVTECTALSRLVADIQQPVNYRAQYIGTPQTNGNSTTVTWRLYGLYRTSQD